MRDLRVDLDAKIYDKVCALFPDEDVLRVFVNMAVEKEVDYVIGMEEHFNREHVKEKRG